MEFFKGLFGQNGFMPHGHCYLWDPGLMRLHLISDFLIATAYFVIPLTLVNFVRKRRDLAPSHASCTVIAKGKINLDIGTVDIHATVRGALEIFKTDIAHKNLRIHRNLAAPQYFAQADDSRLMQVFWNVIKNAIKFTPEGGAIHIESANKDGRLIVDVSDNGIGIEAEVLPRIFDSFEQGVRRVQAGHGGLGLGLAISRAIVEAHRGHMEASSPGRNRGTIVTISLAAVPERSSADESELSEARPLRPH